MGSFFVIQVHTGFEIEVKEMLQNLLEKGNNQTVKCIYAMEKATAIFWKGNELDSLCELSSKEISENLHAKRLQAGLTNLRHACDSLKRYDDNDAMELLSSYKANIWEMTQQLKELRRNNRKISSVLKGYILVETYSNHSSFPANLMHAIHMVPKVVGLPSNNNVPQEEIDFFFQQIDMTPEVEIEIDEIVNVAEAEMTKRELLARANDVIGTNEEKEIFDQMDSINFSFEAELDTLIADYETSHQKKRIDASVRQKINEIKLSMQRKKNRVTMPAALFQSVILNTQNSLSSNMVVSPDCKTLIEGLRKTLESEEGKGVAHGL